MHVVVMPPGVGGLKSYVIATDEYGGMKFATEDGSFEILDWKAVRFATARDAIAYAERQGWTVMNKASSDTIWNPPMSRQKAIRKASFNKRNNRNLTRAAEKGEEE